MKKILIMFLCCFFTLYVKSNDSLKIAVLQKEVYNLKYAVSNLQRENRIIRDLYKEQKSNIDSLQNTQMQLDKELGALANKMGTDLSETNKKLEASASSLNASINSRTWLTSSGLVIALVLLFVVYYILKKKILNGSTSMDKIKAAQDSLETAQKAMHEESVKLDNKLVELLNKQVVLQSQNNINDQQDHTLALKVADEIVRIETNLSRMDESIKGHKQLKKAVERIRANFMANGYEIVDMLGKPYVEGMKATPNFIPDETLKEGEQIITGIIKPQINYKGIMIQSAQITVSQN
ncbi:MAG: hypothetical protein IJE12_02240 [Prevotella sp.]|nr:hypothetical protein [Prevotella sp.]